MGREHLALPRRYTDTAEFQTPFKLPSSACQVVTNRLKPLRQYDYYLGTFGYIRLLHPYSAEVGISLHTAQYMYTQSLRFYKTSSLCLRTFLYARPSVTRGRHQASMVAIYLRRSSSGLSQAAKRQRYHLLVANQSKHEESSWSHLRICCCIAIVHNHHRISQPCASHTASNRI